MSFDSTEKPKQFPSKEATDILGLLTKSLLKERRRRSRRIAILLAILFGVSGTLAIVFRVEDSTLAGEIFLGLAIEVAGAMVTFWLIDYVWQGGEEIHQAGQEMSRRMKILTFKAKKYSDLVQKAYARQREWGTVNPVEVAEIISLWEEIRTDLNSALDYSVPFMSSTGDEIREAIYQWSKKNSQYNATDNGAVK